MADIFDQFSLASRSFVVTGGSSGIGRAMAGFLAQAGARVVLVARREQELADAISEINTGHERASYVCADLLDREELGRVAGRCKAAVSPGVVDGVVNAAGVNLRQAVDEVSSDSWDTTLNLNLAAPFFFTREFVPEMRAQRYGRVINVSSLQSVRAFPDGMPYGASKGGVSQLTRAMAEAWSRDGICCNAVAPGFIPTELAAPVFADEDYREWAAQQTAIGRTSVVEDLAGVTIFLASRASAYVTGQTLFVDGGFSAT